MRVSRFLSPLVLAASSVSLVPHARASDECVSAAPLTVDVPVTGSLAGASSTSGIPSSHCGQSHASRDEWFSFTAPESRDYDFTLCGSAFDTVLSLWSACPDGSRTPLACNDDTCDNASSIIQPMTRGQTLLVRVAGWSGATGTFNLAVRSDVSPPANDDCADAEAIGLGRTSGTTIHATMDGPDGCGAAGPDVWYRFTAPATGQYTFDTCDTVGFNTVLTLKSTCEGPSLVCNDNAVCQAHWSRSSITRSLSQGQTVLVCVSGFVFETGNFILNTTAGGPPPPPVNDECAGALPVSVGQHQPFDITRATTSGQRLSGCGVTTMLNDIFYEFTASCTGHTVVTTCGTGWDSILAVYDRCGGTLLACNNNDTQFVCVTSSGQSALRFPVVEGRAYIIAVGTNLVWHDGRGELNVACVTPPPCIADYNTDGFVDFHDILAFVWCFDDGACGGGRSVDVNRDGFVDFFDYDAFIQAYEQGC